MPVYAGLAVAVFFAGLGLPGLCGFIGEVLVTEKYGSLFLKTFPDSKHVESVRSMMLTSLFMEGEYEKCIEVATVMLPKLASPSKQHDICLHVLGGSYYYTACLLYTSPRPRD